MIAERSRVDSLLLRQHERMAEPQPAALSSEIDTLILKNVHKVTASFARLIVFAQNAVCFGVFFVLVFSFVTTFSGVFFFVVCMLVLSRRMVQKKPWFPSLLQSPTDLSSVFSV